MPTKQRSHPTALVFSFVRGGDAWMMEFNGANARRIVNAAGGLDPAYAGSELSPVVWSPTGERIAYIQFDFSPTLNGHRHSIWTRDSNGLDPQLVMTGTGLRWALYWAADGRIIYSFHEDESNDDAAHSLWAIKADSRTGKVEGSPQRLSTGFGALDSLTVNANGKRAVFLRDNRGPQVFVAQF